MAYDSIRAMRDRWCRSGHRRSPRRAIAALFVLAVLLVVASGGHIPHSHASARPALFNEQHVLENPATRCGDVPLADASTAYLVGVVIAEASSPDDRASSPAPTYARQSRAPPSA